MINIKTVDFLRSKTPGSTRVKGKIKSLTPPEPHKSVGTWMKSRLYPTDPFFSRQIIIKSYPTSEREVKR